MRPEEQLLRYLSSERVSHEKRASHASELIGAAVELGLEGALYGAFRRRRLDLVLSDETVLTLRRLHAETVAHNLALLGAATQLSRELQAVGVPSRALKGLSLLQANVVDTGARPCVDIDVLTRRTDRAAVIRILGQLGYKTSGLGGAPKHLPAFQRGAVIIEIHETAFWAPDGVRYGYAQHEKEVDPLSFTLVHLVHHLHVSSVMDAPLAAKTVCDVVALLAAAPSRPGLLPGARQLAAQVNLAAELDDLLNLAQALRAGQPLDAAGLRVLKLCVPASSVEHAARVVRYYLRGVFESPPWVRRALIDTVLLPKRSAIEAMYGLPAGSWRVYPAYVARPFRALRSALRLLRHGTSDGPPARR